jgi:hypothetical protein
LATSLALTASPLKIAETSGIDAVIIGTGVGRPAWKASTVTPPRAVAPLSRLVRQPASVG